MPLVRDVLLGGSPGVGVALGEEALSHGMSLRRVGFDHPGLDAAALDGHRDRVGREVVGHLAAHERSNAAQGTCVINAGGMRETAGLMASETSHQR